MQLISLTSTDPFFNLAADEFLLKNRSEDFIVLGINDTSVIIGKHQVAHMESDTRYVTENLIPVIRRISGGGTVFHDHGNLNFSFILNSEYGKQVDFRKYTLPVINFLSSFGINALFGGKNDLLLNGFKISGNAEHVSHNRILHHGTLLFNADLDALKGAIRGKKGNYTSKAVVSNPSSVINLKEVLKDVPNTDTLMKMMASWFHDNLKGTEIAVLSDNDVDKIRALAESKYRSWEWNYAYGPDYQFANEFIVGQHNCKCRLNIKNGIITDCEITGYESMLRLSSKLKGSRHMINDMQESVEKVNFLPPGFDFFDFF